MSVKGSTERHDDAIDFGRRRTPVPLGPLADEPQAPKRDARELQRLGTHDCSVDRGGVRQDGFDVAQVDADSDGTRPLFRPRLRESDDSVAIEFDRSKFAQSITKALETGLLRPTDHLAHISEILAVNVDQATERLCGRPIRVYRFAAVDPTLCFSRPGFGVAAKQECLAGVLSLAPDLGSPGTGRKLGEGGHIRVRYVCSQRSKSGERRRILS